MNHSVLVIYNIHSVSLPFKLFTFAKFDIFLNAASSILSDERTVFFMKLFNNNNKKSIIDALAPYYGISSNEFRDEIINIINYAWHSEDPKIKDNQNILFPAGKPTPDEFIQVLITYLK